MADDLTLKETISFIMGWLIRGARRHSWGELRIVVQDGKITGVHEHHSYRARLPRIEEAETDPLPKAALRA